MDAMVAWPCFEEGHEATLASTDLAAENMSSLYRELWPSWPVVGGSSWVLTELTRISHASSYC